MKNKQNVIEWAKEKGILDKSNPLKQHVKTVEEVNEIFDAILNNDKEALADAIGDSLVTLIIQAELNSLDIEDCLEKAYNVISKRTGSMRGGLFIKDE